MIALSSRDDFTLASFRAAAWDGRPVQLSHAAIERIGWARDQFMALLEAEPDLVIYGVTTGYGQNAKQRLTPEQRRIHARTPSLGPATSFGTPFPDRVTRGIVFARLTCFVSGHAAVSPGLAQSVAQMLDGRPLPSVPVEGTGGAGEIQPLSHLFARIGDDLVLAEKEPLALVNGSPVATAVLADAALSAARRAALAMEVFALSIEALRAPLDAYDPALDALWGDEDEAFVLCELRRLIAGGVPDRRPYQAPVSWRILPRILGQVRRAVRQAHKGAETALRSITDNPVFIPPDPSAPDRAHPHGRVLSNGSYQNGWVSPALATLSQGWADLALLCDRHCAKLLDGSVSLLPHGLVSADMPHGTHLWCTPMAAVGFAEHARHAASPALLPGSESGGFGANDIGVPTHLAWLRYTQAGSALDSALAIVATVAAQAFDVTGRAPPPALAALYRMVREEVPMVDEPRAFGPAMGRLSARFSARAHASDAEAWTFGARP